MVSRELDEPSALRWTAGEKAEFPCVFWWGRMSDYGIIFGIVLDDFQGDAWYGYYIL